MLDYINVFAQYCLPKHALSRAVYWLTRVQFKPWKTLLIKIIVKRYNVDLKQAQREKAEDYVSFNDFFTRRLKDDARSWNIDKNIILSPVDGMISQIGKLEGNSIIQAKGKRYTLDQLLAHDPFPINTLHGGVFATLYLSPRDYHRLHMPITGKLIKSIYVGGSRFGVGHASVRKINNLFARNERLISIFETDIGMMVQIMVGAIFVGSMETVWLGKITPAKKHGLIIQDYKDESIMLTQGQEFGHFNMGSTIIIIFEKARLNWLESLKSRDLIKVGQELGKVFP